MVGVEANGAFVGFPIEVVGRESGVVNTEVGWVPVVVVYDAGSQTGIAFERTVGGQTLEFANTPAIRGFRLRAAETGSIWYIGAPCGCERGHQGLERHQVNASLA